MALVLNGDGKISGANLNIDSDGAATFTGLTVDTSTLHVDAVNNRVGIGTTTPAQKLDVSDMQQQLHQYAQQQQLLLLLLIHLLHHHQVRSRDDETISRFQYHHVQ